MFLAVRLGEMSRGNNKSPSLAMIDAKFEQKISEEMTSGFFLFLRFARMKFDAFVQQ